MRRFDLSLSCPLCSLSYVVDTLELKSMKKLSLLACFFIFAYGSDAQQIDSCLYDANIQSSDFDMWPFQFDYDGIIAYDHVQYIDSVHALGFVRIFLQDDMHPYPIIQDVIDAVVISPGSIHIWGSVYWQSFQFSGPFEMYVELSVKSTETLQTTHLLFSRPLLIDPADYIAVTDVENQISSSKDIAVYPNPAGNQVTVKAPPDAKLRILNPLGQDVIIRPNQSTDISALPSGIYFVTGTYQGEAIEPEKLMVR